MTDVNTQYANDAFTTITDVTLDTVTTTINVTDDTDFPAVATPYYFYATLENTVGQIEIVKVTTHVSASHEFTVVRGVDNTPGASWVAGDYIEMRANSGIFEELRDAVATKADTSYVDSENTAQAALYVNVDGDVMTDQLKGIPPLADDDFTRKDYVDRYNFIDIAGAYPGTILINADMVRYLTPRAYNVPIELDGSVAECGVAPTNTVVFTVRKNGVSFGTFTFDNGDLIANDPMVSAAGATFAAGDIITITSPANVYGMQDLSFTISGTYIF